MTDERRRNKNVTKVFAMGPERTKEEGIKCTQSVCNGSRKGSTGNGALSLPFVLHAI